MALDGCGLATSRTALARSSSPKPANIPRTFPLAFYRCKCVESAPEMVSFEAKRVDFRPVQFRFVVVVRLCSIVT